MHSLSSFDRTVTAIESMKYTKANLFLDNDRAGEEHTQQFIEVLGHKAISQSDLFKPYGDLNGALCANNSSMK